MRKPPNLPQTIAASTTAAVPVGGWGWAAKAAGPSTAAVGTAATVDGRREGTTSAAGWRGIAAVVVPSVASSRDNVVGRGLPAATAVVAPRASGGHTTLLGLSRHPPPKQPHLLGGLGAAVGPGVGRLGTPLPHWLLGGGVPHLGSSRHSFHLRCPCRKGRRPAGALPPPPPPHLLGSPGSATLALGMAATGRHSHSASLVHRVTLLVS